MMTKTQFFSISRTDTLNNETQNFQFAVAAVTGPGAIWDGLTESRRGLQNPLLGTHDSLQVSKSSLIRITNTVRV